jgi:hypothetical protein
MKTAQPLSAPSIWRSQAPCISVGDVGLTRELYAKLERTKLEKRDLLEGGRGRLRLTAEWRLRPPRPILRINNLSVEARTESVGVLLFGEAEDVVVRAVANERVPARAMCQLLGFDEVADGHIIAASH